MTQIQKEMKNGEEEEQKNSEICCITTTSRIRPQSIMLDNCLIKIKYPEGDSVMRSITDHVIKLGNVNGKS